MSLHDWPSISKLLTELLGTKLANECFLNLAEKIALGEDITPVMRDIFSRYRDEVEERHQTVPLYTDGLFPADIMIIGDIADPSDLLSELPFTGLHTLAASHCGHCSKVGRCFAEFMGGSGDEPECDEDDLFTLDDIIQLPELKTGGQLLDTVLEESGLERQSWQTIRAEPEKPKIPLYITNVIKYCIDDITDDMIIKGKKWLELEALFVRPKVTILLGETAHKAVGNEKVSLSWAKGHRVKTEGEVNATWFYLKPPYGLVFTTDHPRDITPRSEKTLMSLFKHAINYIVRGTYPHEKDNPN